MKIQNTSIAELKSRKKSNSINNKNDVAFGGAEVFTQFLNFLDTNQTMGATVVDACCMGIPRTTVDFTRGPDAGVETMRREFSCTINNAIIGVYGACAAWALSRAFSHKFDNIKVHKMFISDETLDILAQIRNKHGQIEKSDNNLSNYLEEIFKNTKAFNPEYPEKSKIDEKGWIEIDAKTQKDVVEKLKKELKNGAESLSNDSKDCLKALIVDSTGSEKNFKISHGNLTSNISLTDLIDNVYKVTKTFMNNKVSNTFKNGHLNNNEFIKDMKKLNKGTSLLGLAAAMTVALSVQPINMYLTKLKTGKSGFVGVEGRESDKSDNFKFLKFGAAALAALGTIKTIGKLREIPLKIQFKGIMPTINQFKFIYGATIASRIIVARDKNELRETTLKDSLGFVNWLILGGFVSKLTAAGLDKMSKFKNDKFIRYNAAENGKGWFNWLTKSNIVSREEVLHSALKKAGISTIKSNGKAMTFKEMLIAVAKHAPEANSKIKYLGFIQFAGYLYSGLVLGIGIPKLNIAVTNHFEKKNKTKEASV